MYSIGDKTESALSSEDHTDDECDSMTETLGADRARGKDCDWDAAGISRLVLWLVAATVLLPSDTAAFTVTKKLHRSVSVAGRADDNNGRSPTRSNSGTSPNYDKHIINFRHLSKQKDSATNIQNVTYIISFRFNCQECEYYYMLWYSDRYTTDRQTDGEADKRSDIMLHFIMPLPMEVGA